MIRISVAGLGYNLLGTRATRGGTADQVLVTELAVNAVLCPTFAHLEDQVPAELLTITEVIVIDPGRQLLPMESTAAGLSATPRLVGRTVPGLRRRRPRASCEWAAHTGAAAQLSGPKTS